MKTNTLAMATAIAALTLGAGCVPTDEADNNGGGNTDPLIEDRSEYRPSTDIHLGGDGTLLGSTASSGQFQFNLEYSNLTTYESVEIYNDNQLDLGNHNWIDPQYYTFVFYGGEGNSLLDVYNYDDAQSPNVTISGSAEWTISSPIGWGHTPFHGSWEDNDLDGTLSNGDFLRLDPRGYHSFGFGANGIEIWGNAYIPTEILGYTYTDENGGADVYLKVVIKQ